MAKKKTLKEYEDEVDTTKKPDLEAIAEHLGGIEEKYNVGQLDPIIANAFRTVDGLYDEKTGKYMEDLIGKRGMAIKKAMADSVINALGDHIYKNILKKMGSAEYLEMLRSRDPNGQSIQDVLVREYFGIDRESLYKELKGLRRITQATIANKIQKLQQDHVGQLKSRYLTENIKQQHVGDMSKWFKSKIDDGLITEKDYHLYQSPDIQDHYQNFLGLVADQYHPDQVAQRKKKKAA